MRTALQERGVDVQYLGKMSRAVSSALSRCDRFCEARISLIVFGLRGESLAPRQDVDSSRVPVYFSWLPRAPFQGLNLQANELWANIVLLGQTPAVAHWVSCIVRLSRRSAPVSRNCFLSETSLRYCRRAACELFWLLSTSEAAA